ncbi:MAG TPA: AAA family ATPase, partial [Bacteroidales bacterium]|nr:AAA family ATPase [Bacteroidales bacterium]
MIKYIAIKNFKAFKSLKLKPSNLNLCFGMNGMGKSSLLQSLLLLRQSFQKGLLDTKGLLLNDKDLISIGTGKDAYYQSAGRGEH